MIKKTLPAIRLQISILCLNPDDIPTLNRLARLFIHEEKLDNALAAFEEILVIDKNNIACLKNLSEIYFKTKNYKKALLMARLILKTKPHDLEAETILKDIAAITTIEKGFDEIKPAV
ncbi:MAG: tetratricopeptide repeat protein [Candidatus Omnitrophica bacterium]|nr:tetratricopeptide repeat protein [Candidatus Omnitrophota bacterium]